jgi:hypothetical protein
MPRNASVLLLDDGELDDVQGILEELGVSYSRVRGEATPAQTGGPHALLVATPRRIDSIASRDVLSAPGCGPLRVVVVSEDSTTLREQLREIGFDFLVRRPVHPDVLRMLVFHCLYKGEERRRYTRIPVGFEVVFRTGLLPRRAVLTDLSGGGCRLLSPYALEPGKRIKIQIPPELGASEPLLVPGRVVRIHLDEHLGGDGLYGIAVRFEKLSSGLEYELAAVVKKRANGRVLASEGEEAADGDPDPACREMPLRGAGSEPSRARPLALAAPTESPGPADPDGEDRRKVRRATYDRSVPAFGDPLRILLGRDISAGGMRIERQRELRVGDRLHLAVYGEPGQDPILIWASVARDDGEAGMALVFDPVPASVSARLESLVANLPAVEPLAEGEAAALGSVVTRILER